MIYQNKTENFKWAFLFSSLLVLVAICLLFFWRKKQKEVKSEEL